MRRLGMRDHARMGDPAETLAVWRARVLDARIAGRAVLPPPELRDACMAWLAEAASGDAVALGVSGVPEAWVDTLGWSGVPLAPGPLHWGADIRQDGVPVPSVRDGVLLLPTPEELASQTSLALKPMRLFVAERLGCRLQAAPGIRLWLWPDHAALQSLSPLPLAGFLYGRAAGHRSGISLEAWGCQVITW